MSSTPPGYHHGQGDPPGTVRWWDGTQWVGDPVPAPPGWTPPPKPRPNLRFGNVGRRIAATMIDAAINAAFLLAVAWDEIRSLFEQLSDGVPQDEIVADFPPGLYVMGVAIFVVFTLLVAYAGGTPGKLLLGLRITLEDGATTPPGLGRALLRRVPDAVALLPGVGGVLASAVLIGSLVMVIVDAERRSVFDRIGGTRVVYADRLPPPTPAQ